MNTSAYNQVLRLYETDRDRARKLHEQRKSEVYTLLPRVGELDAELSRISLQAARGVLQGGVDTVSVKRRIEVILAEKRALMEQAGVSDDYLTNVHTCPHCNDTGYVDTQKCRCLKQRMIDRHYSMAGLGAAIAKENFQSFDLRYYSDKPDPVAGVSPLVNIRKVYRECVDFVTNFGDDFSNLLFYGETGLGKTFLCNCIARDLLDAGISVLYVTAPALFKKIEESRFGRKGRDASDESDARLELVYEAELLIIDDLGSEFATIVTDAELFNIINSRLLARRPTVISTNLSMNDFQNAYTERIVSRISGGYLALRLFGDDIRLKKKILAMGVV
jgi:DNA replication protein DnaC